MVITGQSATIRMGVSLGCGLKRQFVSVKEEEVILNNGTVVVSFWNLQEETESCVKTRASVRGMYAMDAEREEDVLRVHFLTVHC